MVKSLLRLRFRWPAGLRAAVLAIGLVASVPVLDAAHAAGLAADVTTSQEKGFGRIVISFRDRMTLPQYVVKNTNGVLVIQFGESVDMKVDRLPIDLPNFVTVARVDPDGQAARLALQRQIRVNTIEAGEKLFVDLLPMSWSGPLPGLPEPVVQELAKRADVALKAAREAESARFGIKIMPKLDFRVARLPTFTRFSFGWNVPFDTQMSRDGDRVAISFNRIAQVDFAALLADPPPGLKEVQAQNEGEKLTVVLKVAPEADIRGFRDDQTYVVDLTMPDQAAGQKGPSIVTTPVPNLPTGAQQKVSLPAPVASAPATQPAAPVQQPVVAANPPAQVIQPVPAPAMPAKEEPKTGPVQNADEVVAGDEAGSGEIPPSQRPESQTAPKVIRAEAKRIGNIVRVSFPFRERVASAAFKRENTLWVVFDSRLPLDIKSLATVLGSQASDVKVVPVEDGQAVRVDLTEPQLTTLGMEGNSWILSIGELVLEPSRPLRIERGFKADRQGYIRVAMQDPGMLHTIRDPIVGDTMMVVTAFAPARGMTKAYSFTELDALATAHGIVAVPRVDDLKAAIDPGGVTFSRDEGLNLSPEGQQRVEVPVPRQDKRAKKITIDGTAFATSTPGDFSDMQRQLLDEAASAPESRRLEARMKLAQFYLSNRFSPEALGIMRRVAQDEPGIERDPGFIVLYAAAQALTGRAGEARKALARNEVADSADAALWRTIAAVEASQWDEARQATPKALGAVAAYPPDIQALFRLAAAEAAIELNDFPQAQIQLAAIQPEDIDPSLRNRYEILQGRVADAAGRSEDALARYQRAADSGDREAAAEAEYRRVRQLVRDDKIPRDEAIKAMRSLAFSWRGDEIELKTLRFLANMEAQSGLYSEAFADMRAAVMVNPNAETTRLLQDEMSDEFISLFLDGKAERMDPIAALTLFYNYRDLIPPGRQADEIVRKIADRLVAADLLDQAEELLNYQIDNRLQGAARAQISADLAVVYLMDRKPDQALAVLNKTRQSGLPVSIDRQRRLVEARALGDAGRTDLALEFARTLTGADAERLRSDILWKSKRWGPSGERLEAMLGSRWSDAAPLDNQERQDVMRAAVSFALANDQTGLDRLRTKFQAKMSNSPNARAFDIVTRPIQSMGGDFRDVARQISEIDSLRGFVDEYRANYLQAKPFSGNGKPADGAPEAAPKPSAKAASPTKVAAN